jgi:hypothetical protein
VFRELHKEFSNDPELARVRAWICSDRQYVADLRETLQSRKIGPVDLAAYKRPERLIAPASLTLWAVVDPQS